MFLGTYQTVFSGLNRVILPKKFRVELTEGKVILTRGLDGCIWGFEKKGWEEQAQKQLAIPLTEKQGRDLRRYIFSEAEVAELDRQGRFVIPTRLLSFAGIKDVVILVGAGDHFEIWDEKKWSEETRNFNQ